MKRFAGNKIKIWMLMLVFVISAASISGCNNGDNPDAQQEADDGASDTGAADVLPGDNAGDNLNPAQDNNGNPDITRTDVPDEPEQTPIAEKSPIAITRIEPENIHIPDEPYVTGEGFTPVDDDNDKDSDGDGIPDEHDHDPVPNLFPVDKCQVEVNGSYKKDLANELITQINACRTSYDIPPVTRNTSLLACADNRAKEQTYFIGHFRPNGAPFWSIAPEGQVLGECIAVDYRDAEKMVDAWYSVNETRMQLMNPDYTQVGVSIYEVDDTYFIAAEFAY